MSGGALPCHDSRCGGAGQAGVQREETPVGTAVRKAPALRGAGGENREDGGLSPAQQVDQRGTPALPAAKRLGGVEKSCAEGVLPADLCRTHENGGVINANASAFIDFVK